MTTPSTSTNSSFSPSLWVGRKLDLILTAWTALAPDESFAEMTLEEFREAAKPSSMSRGTLATLGATVKAGIAERQIADEATQLLIKRAVCGVIGDAGYGPDCALYRAMGFVRSSERKSSGTTADPTAPKAPRLGLMERLDRVTRAWKELAPSTAFSGMTLQQFTAATAASGKARAALAAARTNLKGGIATKSDADEVTSDLIKRVVSGVRSARRFGDNCALYRAMGYRIASERRPYKRKSLSGGDGDTVCLSPLVEVLLPSPVGKEAGQPMAAKPLFNEHATEAESMQYGDDSFTQVPRFPKKNATGTVHSETTGSAERLERLI